MRRTFLALSIALTGLLIWPAMSLAQENDDESSSPPPRRPVARERLLRAFDKDGDGRLDEGEIDAAREQLGERFDGLRAQIRELRDRREAHRHEDRRGGEAGGRPEGQRQRGDEPRGDESRGARGRGTRVESAERSPGDRRGPGGPPGPGRAMGGRPQRDLATLFTWFDTDGDNMLSRREFGELSQFVERHHPGGPRDAGPAERDRRGRAGFGPGFGGGFGRGGFRGSPDRLRRREGLRGDRPQRREGDDLRPAREEPPQPPRPQGPPEPPAQPEPASEDAG